MSKCKCKHKVSGAMPAANEPDWMLLAATVLGGAASNVVVNPIANAIWNKGKDTSGANFEKAGKNAGFLKIGLGIAGVMYAPNDYLAVAALGMVVDGGAQLLRSKVTAFQGLYHGLSDNQAVPGVGGIGEVIDLSHEDWYRLNGIESDHAVGYAEQAYAVSGGVN